MYETKKNNYGTFAEKLIGKYFGKYIGVFDDICFVNNLAMTDKKFALTVPNIPGYAAKMYGEMFRMDYHLAGFSVLKRNSFVRATGEAVERYSHIMAETGLKKEIILASYDELKKKGFKVCPLEYANVYTEEQLVEINIPGFIKRHINKSDCIEWLCCKSIYDDTPVYIPAQMFFLMSSNKRESRYYMSVSTGTASHKTKEKAMMNALTEYLQVDSMMMCWYVFGKMQKIENSELVIKLINQVGCSDEYEVDFFDMTLDKPLPVVGCIMRNKKKQYPYCTYGMQADFSMEKAMYRSFMEAYANIGPRLTAKDSREEIDFCYISTQVKQKRIYDLNGNTKFYLDERAVDEVDAWLEKILNYDEIKREEPKKQDKTILDILKEYLLSMSEFACYLDITSNEFKEDDWTVIRTVVPELLPLCMPSIPYKNHPRVKINGGVRNECIHPCP